MLRNLFLAAGTFLILFGLYKIVFSPPGLYWSYGGGNTTSTPASFALVALSEPVLLVLGGMGMMLGAIAAAAARSGEAASGGGLRRRDDHQQHGLESQEPR
ncbi:hypothetical protein AB0G15_36760 [Streptosporangium sp. NPDC023825]|uniref:hypothetical protein n=1 Tax=Streptosporangium sp. NPDC023825 TaxID=3154909 RepID=UPI00342D20B7